ncbi:unnamed protein product, partial [Pylaiella littoralis]
FLEGRSLTNSHHDRNPSERRGSERFLSVRAVSGHCRRAGLPQTGSSNARRSLGCGMCTLCSLVCWVGFTTRQLSPAFRVCSLGSLETNSRILARVRIGGSFLCVL